MTIGLLRFDFGLLRLNFGLLRLDFDLLRFDFGLLSLNFDLMMFDFRPSCGCPLDFGEEDLSPRRKEQRPQRKSGFFH